MSSKYAMDQAGYKQSLKDQGLSAQKITAIMKKLDSGDPERVADYEGFLSAMFIQAEQEAEQMQPVEVTVSDEEYSELLRNRLAAKHGFEAGEVTLEEYNMARTLVRRARKVRRVEGAVVENYRQQSRPQHEAMTRKVAA